MSASGPKQTSRLSMRMSAFGGKADTVGRFPQSSLLTDAVEKVLDDGHQH